jgi:hypothetical protein
VGTVIGMLVVLALVPLAWWRMLRGWRGRAESQSALPEPAEVPEELGSTGPPAELVAEGVYVSTTLAGQPLERVVAHGLGTRSAVHVVVEASTPRRLALVRPGTRSFAVPATDLVGAHRSRGQAGKFTFGKEGIVVVTWRLGGTELDTGVRCRHRADADRLVAAVAELAGTGSQEAA